MTVRSLTFGFLAAVAGLAAGPPAPAQKAADPASAAKDDAKAKKAPGRTLTGESLPETLDAMGYDFTTTKLPSGSTLHTLKLQRDGWTFVVEVSLSTDGGNLWLVAPLQDVPAGASAEPLVLLLKENWSISPHAFAIPKDGRRVYLQRAVENRDITPSKIRAALDAITGTVRATEPLWNTGKWAPPAPSPVAGVAPSADTPEALARLFEELMAAAKGGNRDQLAARVKPLALPNPDAWFKTVFGAETGAALAAEYARDAAQTEAGLIRTLLSAAEEGQTTVRAARYTRADAEKAAPAQARALGAMAAPVPLYSVRLTQPGEATGLHLYSFVFADGGFRAAGKMRAVGPVAVGGEPGLMPRVAVATLTAGPPPQPGARATRYALVALRNTTGSAVTYHYWWGRQAWDDGGSDGAEVVTLRPGERMWHSRGYTPGWGDAPPLRVMFPAFARGAAGPGSIPREYALDWASADAKDPRYARVYEFGWGLDQRLDLFTTDRASAAPRPRPDEPAAPPSGGPATAPQTDADGSPLINRAPRP